MRPVQNIRWAVVHHSASNDLYSNAAALKAERAHRGEGYNFIVDDDDALRSAKAGSDGKFTAVQDAPDTTVSNGTYGINQQAWNICVDGNFEHQVPTADEIHAVVQVLASKLKSWGWRKRDVSRIIGHSQAGALLSPRRYGTACPGKNMIAKLPEIRRRVAVYLPE